MQEQWINVSDEQPETEIRVLITDGDTIVGAQSFYNEVGDLKWFCDFGYEVKSIVTHWQPFLQPPQK